METIFRKASPDDVDGIMPVIDYARNKMLSEGKKQWDTAYPLREHISADIGGGNGYVLCHGTEIIAYGAIFNGEPAYADIQGKWPGGDCRFIVLHRLAVAACARRHGMATRFFHHAVQLAQRQGIHSFRVDTNFDNTAMLSLLDKLGFTHCGEVHYAPGKTRMAYEKLL